MLLRGVCFDGLQGQLRFPVGEKGGGSLRLTYLVVARQRLNLGVSCGVVCFCETCGKLATFRPCCPRRAGDEREMGMLTSFGDAV